MAGPTPGANITRGMIGCLWPFLCFAVAVIAAGLLLTNGGPIQ